MGLLIWFALGALIGAGFFAPFKRPRNGAAWGLVAQLVLWMVLIAFGKA